jgi:hypothetical protein
MPDKAVLILEYRVIDGEVCRRAEVFGLTNAVRQQRQCWMRLYDAKDEGPTEADSYGQNNAAIARARFLVPAIERFFAFAPALVARTLTALPLTSASVYFETGILFEGDIFGGTRFLTDAPCFRLKLGDGRDDLLYFDPEHLPNGPWAQAAVEVVPNSSLLKATLEAVFGEAIFDLLTALPCFSADYLAARPG